jgi:hypothetical protein
VFTAFCLGIIALYAASHLVLMGLFFLVKPEQGTRQKCPQGCKYEDIEPLNESYQKVRCRKCGWTHDYRLFTERL